MVILIINLICSVIFRYILSKVGQSDVQIFNKND